VEVGNNVLPAA